MVLSVTDHRAMMRGFGRAGFACAEVPTAPTNPVRVEWHVDGDTTHRYRLWAFDVTAAAAPKSAPLTSSAFRSRTVPARSTNSIKGARPTSWSVIRATATRSSLTTADGLKAGAAKKAETGSDGSPSVQVKEADIQAGHDKGVHYLSKAGVAFGIGDIVTMSPEMLPAYLLNHAAILRGEMSAAEAITQTPKQGPANILDYCQRNGFPFEADLVARYIASMLTKPLVILAGVSGTGKSKLAGLVVEFYTGRAVAGPGAPGNPANGAGFVLVPTSLAPDRTRFALVAVRPDWIDHQSVLGFVNPIAERYESTQALDLILRAHAAHEGAPDKAAAPRYFRWQGGRLQSAPGVLPGKIHRQRREHLEDRRDVEGRAPCFHGVHVACGARLGRTKGLRPQRRGADPAEVRSEIAEPRAAGNRAVCLALDGAGDARSWRCRARDRRAVISGV
jgi:hypothetical protein